MPSLIAAALRNRLSAGGIALTTASAILFLALVALELLGYLQNPYTGIVIFVMVPALFVLGLLLIPLGLWLERRRRGSAPAAATAWPSLNLSDPNTRRTLAFVAIATLLNLGILSIASFGAVEYSESQAFCGQACHAVMGPEFVSQQGGPHARVHCVACHVGPGAGAFLSAKLSGSRQLGLVMMGSFQRPIPAPIHNLPAVQDTCEQCHWPDRYLGEMTKVFYEHADDEANTPTKTTVRLKVGGPIAGTRAGEGIHWHMNRGNVVEYVSLDEAREQIAYVRTTTPDGRVREYFAEGVGEAEVAGRPRRRMDCLDCHNRPAHTFGTTAERAVDEAIGGGLIDARIPFIRREAVRALRTLYPSHEAASAGIDRAIREAMNARLPHAFEEASLQRAIGVTQGIYARNVFPAMNIRWGTYANQSGHTTSSGCFRCHTDTHKTRDGLAIRQDCEMCHTIE
jgi:hypothetical protein